MQKLKLYEINDDYTEYLRTTVNSHVFSNTGNDYIHSRKYLGIILRIGVHDYYVPLSSPKKSDYKIQNGKRIIRKSIIPIMRITDTDQAGNRILLGTLKFSNMIPVPADCVHIYDPDAETDKKYKAFIGKEIRFIRKNSEKIIRNAQIIYKQKLSGRDINYLNNTLDFGKLETACLKYRKNS